MMASPKAACTTPTVRGGKKCDRESLDSIMRRKENTVPRFPDFITKMDGTAFLKSDTVRWGSDLLVRSCDF